MPTIKNPPWSRDELIVALSFYLQHTPSIPGKTSTEIAELSELLTRLQHAVGGEVSDTFRNVSGAYMKLMNFRRFDPSYKGVGLQRGNKDEAVVWNLYASKPDELRRLADAIRSHAMSGEAIPPTEYGSDNGEDAEEGKLLTRIHRYRERNSKLIKQKKDQFLRLNDALVCEVCTFDFATVYGDRGDGFIECHHIKPVSELKRGEKTKLNDLALVCSNCHRMIHRKQPWLSVGALKAVLA